MNASSYEAAVGPDAGRQTCARVVVAVLGTGGVGSTLLRQLALRAPADVALVAVANSRQQRVDAEGLDPASALAHMLAAGEPRSNAAILGALEACPAVHRVIVDATASHEVAARHPFWLAQGYHVVTANKCLNGGSQADWHAIEAALRAGGASYGSSATVGAGLPVIDTLRRWRLVGDRLRTVEGVFSGSLSWLFNRYDGIQPFSTLLAHAREAGFCEPDPRADLSGADVARKLLILARSAGESLHADAVQVDSLVPEDLRAVPLAEFEARISQLDDAIHARWQAARAAGGQLRYLARFDGRGARVGLSVVGPEHPAARLAATDNLFVLSSASYHDQPVIIRGPGAGTTVTAQALLADVLQVGGW